MSETIKSEDRFLEATETGIMDLSEPVLENAGRVTWLDDLGRRIARNPCSFIVTAAALGFLLGRGCPVIRHSGALK